MIFAGDSAHNMPTFGARGGNGGIQDVDNLGWKLAAVLNGEARANLLESYNHERIIGADENILHSTRTTRFMSPDDGVERLFRDAVLELAATAPFARKIVNSGRLSLPAHYKELGAEWPGCGWASRGIGTRKSRPGCAAGGGLASGAFRGRFHPAGPEHETARASRRDQHQA